MKKQTSATTEISDKGRKIIDYSGMVIHVGIDVHQESYQVAAVLNGVCLRNDRMNSRSDGLIKYLHSHYPGASFKCVYESSAWGFTLQRALQTEGIDCIVVHAADVATSDKEKKRKTDPVDALKLAHNHASGNLKAIDVPDENIQKERNLIRFRKKLVYDLGRSKNRLKSLLKFQGIDIPEQHTKSNWSRNFLNWVAQQAEKDEYLKDTLLLMLEQIKALRQVLLKTEGRLREMRKTRYADKAALAMSVPGIGPTAAMLFLLEVGDVKRFNGFDALNDFVGFCPDTASSGATERDKGITARRHKQLRTIFIEAAWTAIRTDPALMASYKTLIKRMEDNHAIIRIARKLLRRLRAVMIKGIPYEKGVVA